jgi:hypothetical protein
VQDRTWFEWKKAPGEALIPRSIGALDGAKRRDDAVVLRISTVHTRLDTVTA